MPSPGSGRVAILLPAHALSPISSLVPIYSDPIRSDHFALLQSDPLRPLACSDPIPLSNPTLSKRPSFLPSLLCAKLQFGSGFLPSSHIRSEPPSDPIRSPAQLSATFPATCLRRSTTFLTNLTILINHNSCQIVITTCKNNHKHLTTIQMNQNGSKVAKTSHFPIIPLNHV